MGLTNNDIFKKLRVAHHLTNKDIVEICALKGFVVSESELGAIFRKEGHPKYVECGDQYLRNFLDGLIIHLRGPKPKPAKERRKYDKGSQKQTSNFSEKRAASAKKKRRRVNRPKKD